MKISEADPKLSLAARLQNSFMSSSVFYPVYTYDSAYRFDKELKVVGNEIIGGSRRRQMLDNGLGPWRSRFLYSLNMQFLIKNLISFSACNS